MKQQDIIKTEVRIPREAYEAMKQKAEKADISFNKFLNRAGSIVTAEQVAVPPGFNTGVPSQ